jgi:hypothetical protein
VKGVIHLLKKKLVITSKKKSLITKKEAIDNKVNETQPETRVIVIRPGERITIVSEGSTKTPNFNFDELF